MHRKVPLFGSFSGTFRCEKRSYTKKAPPQHCGNALFHYFVYGNDYSSSQSILRLSASPELMSLPTPKDAVFSTFSICIFTTLSTGFLYIFFMSLFFYVVILRFVVLLFAKHLFALHDDQAFLSVGYTLSI